MTPGRVYVCPTCSRSFASGELHCPFDGAKLGLTEKAEDPMVGKTIGGRYSIIGRLGSGGMGVVYRAVQSQLDRAVALKVLSGSFNIDPQIEERFRTEARAASQLASAHTVTVYDFGATDEGALYLAMQLIEGESLRSRLGAGPLHASDALTIAGQVAESLAEAHARKPAIIHRDIKPDNIMLKQTQDGQPFAVVLDFGLARFSDTQRLTATNSVIGTPAYMSPEQARGGAEVDARSDIYAVGIVLCEMLTGRTPFESQDPVQLLFKQAFDPPPTLAALKPGIQLPEGLQELVSDLLAKAPAARPLTASAVQKRINEILQRLPIDDSLLPTQEVGKVTVPVGARKTPPGFVTHTRPTAPEASEPTPGTAAVVKQANQLRRTMQLRVAVLGFLLVAAVGVAVALFYFNRPGDGTDAPTTPEDVPAAPAKEAQAPPSPPRHPHPKAHQSGSEESPTMAANAKSEDPKPAEAPAPEKVAEAPAPAPPGPAAADKTTAPEKADVKARSSVTQEDLDKLKL